MCLFRFANFQKLENKLKNTTIILQMKPNNISLQENMHTIYRTINFNISLLY
jgi:hypothetical protein